VPDAVGLLRMVDATPAQDQDATRPTTPDGTYLAAVRTAIDRAAATAEPLRSTHAGAAEDLLAATEAAVEGLGEDLLALSHALHAHPEEGFAEHDSVRAVADLLARHDVEAMVGVHGLDTALRASVSSGEGPTVAVLAEYDALPGIGHGCGHNVICATAVGAFLGLVHALRSGAVTGTVVLFGTPAEEGGGGKELMARDGAFDGIDAVVMLHPFSYDVAIQPFLGRRQVRATYHGVAAHASAQPFMGRNALDAVVAGYTGIAMLRQHTTPSDRIHGIVVDGGQRPNVVPATASAEYYVRSAEPATLADLCSRVDLVLRAAAAMTGTGVELEWDRQPAYLPIRANRELAARWTTHQDRRGRTALPPGVVPETLSGSTDLGNVSVRVPAIHPMLAISSPDLSLHTAEFAAAAGSATGDRGVLDGAVGLALTALDVLADPELLAAVRTEFEGAGGVLDVEEFLR
jgi:amidohydrolase